MCYNVILTLNILSVLKNKYDFDYSLPHIKKFIHDEIGIRYKDFRARLYTSYRKMGGPNGARAHIHKEVTTEDWEMLCDRWESQAWQVCNI